jgi:DNA-directed RNA polymerase subunit M/transcription elongation factor TFIIS
VEFEYADECFDDDFDFDFGGVVVTLSSCSDSCGCSLIIGIGVVFLGSFTLEKVRVVIFFLTIKMSKRITRNLFNNIPSLDENKTQSHTRMINKPLTTDEIYKLLCINTEKPVANYQCKKCKSSNVTYVLKQLRAADEGMTPIFTCLDCNAYWKGSQ